VWWADPTLARPAHLALLNADELDRYSALRRPADRDRFAIAAALLRLVCADAIGLPAQQVPVDRTCPRCERAHGRPTIPGYGLHVSVSHSGRRVAIATGPVPLGVDVEEVTPIALGDLAEPTLGPGEAVGRVEEFFTYWTRKESAVKATGDGLAVPLSGILVSRPQEPARLVAYGTRPGLVATMRDLRPGTGYAAALTLLADGPWQVRERDATRLLADA
jgi:4'-phosphopantetheinyl transferase